MSRYWMLLLVPVLAAAAPVWGEDALKPLPPLESRVGQRVTVVEAQKPTDQAVITHVWRLNDGTPVMQAKSLSTGLQVTMVENVKATKAADRIKVYHWSKDGVAPAGCPTLPGVAKVAAPATTMGKTVATTEGGLLPVLTKPEAPKTVTTVAATKPVSAPAATMAKATAPVAKPAAPMTAASAPKLPMTSIQTVQATTPPRPVVVQTAPVVVQGMPMVAPRPQLIGGCEVITVNENGRARQFKVVGMARNPGGMMVQRCEALDNGQIVTLNCGECPTPAVCVTPCPTPCPPVVCKPVPCPPVVCKPAPCPPVVCAPKCEPVKPCPAPCPPAKVCCEPAKKCEPCPVVCEAKPCHDQSKWRHDDCDDGKRQKERVMKNWGLINVPVPGVRLGGPSPSGLPPQAVVPSYCSANSPSVLAAIHGPVLVPMTCSNVPFSPFMNCQIENGIHLAQDGVEAQAIKNTLHLMNVLATSRQWENRQWAADRLQAATLPSLRPYVEDSLLSAAQSDRAPQVKASALRALVHLNPQRPDLMRLLAQSMQDGEPMVQQAAGEILQSLMKAAGVQQAGYQK